MIVIQFHQLTSSHGSTCLQIKENQIVGAHTTIAGLGTTSLNCFDQRGSSTLNSIGAMTSGNVISWTLSPPQTINLASPHPLSINNVGIEIPQRTEFEQALVSWVDCAVPKDGIISKTKNIFGWNCSSSPKAARKDKAKLPIHIIKRRLLIGAHNGNALLHNRWHEVDMHEGSDENLDLLTSNDAVELSTYINDPNCAILFLIEYTCGYTNEGGRVKSPMKVPSTADTTITIGFAAFCPSDKNQVPPMTGETQTTRVINDLRCNAFTANTVFSPSQNSPTGGPKMTVLFDIAPGRESEVAQVQRLNNDQYSVSLDGSTKTKFVRISTPKKKGCEAKVDWSPDSLDARVTYVNDTSTLTFEDSYIEELDSHVAVLTSPLERASRARSRGIDQVVPSTLQYEANCSYSASLETEDPSTTTLVTIKFISFTVEGDERAPASLSFRFKFLHQDEIGSAAFPLNTASRFVSTFAEHSNVSFRFDLPPNKIEATRLAHFMLEHQLSLYVFNEAKFHVGTLSLPMYLFLRQGKPSKLLENITLNVIMTQPLGELCPLQVREGESLPGRKAGRIALSIECEGVSRDITKHTTSSYSSEGRKSFALDMLDTNRDLQCIAAYVQQKSQSSLIDSAPSIPNPQTPQQEQLNAVNEYLYQKAKTGDRWTTESIESFLTEITPIQGTFQPENAILNAARLLREYEKRKVIANHAQSNGQESYPLKPELGQVVLVEYELTNKMATLESFTVESTHPGIRIITNAIEWSSRRNATGAHILPGKEHLMNFDVIQENKISMQPHETLIVPIALDCRTYDQIAIAVYIVSVRNGYVVASFTMNVEPRHRIDRNFNVPCSENEHLKRALQFYPKDVHSNDSQKATLTIKCIASSNVNCEWNKSLPRGPQDIVLYDLRIDARSAGRASSSDRFHIVISNDDFNTILESWQFSLEVKSPLFETVCLGERLTKEIVAKGHAKNTHVKCFASILPNGTETEGNKPLCHCEPLSLQLMSNALNRFHVSLQLFSAGSRKCLIHLVDEATGALVHSYLLSIQCHLPSITKEYNVNVIPGKAKQLKLPITNELGQRRTVELSTSNELILTPHSRSCLLEGNETVYARLQVLVDERNMTSVEKGIEVYLFTKDTSSRTEDCVRINIRFQKK